MTTTETTANGEPLYRETVERFWVLRLDIRVDEDAVRLKLGPIQRSFERVPVQNVEDVRVTTYSGSAYGGWHWGLRTSLGGNTVYRLRGDRGVELRMRDGRRIFVGSQRPEALERAITQAQGATSQ